MSKHTPGPWSCRQKQPRTVRLKRVHWKIGQNDGQGVAIAFGDDEANARLITAAPRLLDALKGVLKWADLPKKERERNSLVEMLMSVSSAIKEAEGEEL